MRAFEYARAASLEGLDLNGRTRPLAGGTDLLTLMKADLVAPERLIDVKAVLPRGIEKAADAVTLGALTTLDEIESDAFVSQRYAALAQAAAAAATPQLRNMATIGGNLLQRPRCWYFRNPRVPCWLKGAEACPARDGENREHALFGDSPCVAAHPSDLAPALLAFDAAVRIRGAQGERSLALESFFALPRAGRRTETVLGEDELILGIRLPAQPEATRSAYLKAMDRKTWSFALAGVAAVLRLSGTKIVHARIVLGGVAPVPWRAEAAERELAGAEAGEAVFARAADAALQGAAPLRHNYYKVPLARALVRRALQLLVK